MKARKRRDGQIEMEKSQKAKIQRLVEMVETRDRAEGERWEGYWAEFHRFLNDGSIDHPYIYIDLSAAWVKYPEKPGLTCVVGESGGGGRSKRKMGMGR